jgi:hypothetical protein
MLMVEECRLRLFDNMVSEGRGGVGGRRRGGAIAPMATTGSKVLILSDRPAEAIGAVAPRFLSVSNPRMMAAVALVELGMSSSPPEAMGSTRRRKRRQNKPTVGVRNALFDLRNSMVNNGLSERHSTRGVQPKPTSAVATRSIRLDERLVAMGRAAREHRRPRILLIRSTGTIEADLTIVQAIRDALHRDLVCSARSG